MNSLSYISSAIPDGDELQRIAGPRRRHHQIRLGAQVPADAMGSIRRQLQLDHFKWDTQVGDSGVLSSQPLLIAEEEWQWLCKKAEDAAEELFAFEKEIACSPALQRLIGVPPNCRICWVLSEAKAACERCVLTFIRRQPAGSFQR